MYSYIILNDLPRIGNITTLHNRLVELLQTNHFEQALSLLDAWSVSNVVAYNSSVPQESVAFVDLMKVHILLGLIFSQVEVARLKAVDNATLCPFEYKVCEACWGNDYVNAIAITGHVLGNASTSNYLTDLSRMAWIRLQQTLQRKYLLSLAKFFRNVNLKKVTQDILAINEDDVYALLNTCGWSKSSENPQILTNNNNNNNTTNSIGQINNADDFRRQEVVLGEIDKLVNHLVLLETDLTTEIDRVYKPKA